MAEKLAQFKDENPVIQAQSISTTAKGEDDIAKTLGSIASAAAQSSIKFASEASASHLMQNQGMLADVEANAKLELHKNPGNYEHISRNAQSQIDAIKSSASVNPQDRDRLDLLAGNALRQIKVLGAQKQFDLSQEAARDTLLATYPSTLQQINNSFFKDPKLTEELIKSQHEALHGQVQSGVLTAQQALVLHKQLDLIHQKADWILNRFQDGTATPEQLSAAHSLNPLSTPYDNTHLPMSGHTTLGAAHFDEHLNIQDIKSTVANGGKVPLQSLMKIPKMSTLEDFGNYMEGVAHANGIIQGKGNWPQIKKEADLLNTKHAKLTTAQEGFRDRLNSYILGIEKGNKYAEYVAHTPLGAQATVDFMQSSAAIASNVYVDQPNLPADVQRAQAQYQNFNNYISRITGIGIGMDVPDAYRNPIPEQFIAPIKAAFEPKADPTIAFETLAKFTPQNRIYVSNSIENGRQALTVYQTGMLLGKADRGFLNDFWMSQQDGATPTEKASLKQESFMQLQLNKLGVSAQTITDKVHASLAPLNAYLLRQERGNEFVSDSVDQGVRYVKYMASKRGDTHFDHLDEYIKTYTDNLNRAYDIKSSWSYMLDKNIIPLESPQRDLVTAYALKEVAHKVRNYMNTTDAQDFFSRANPIVVNNPMGRISVVDQYGRLIPDENGRPAFSEMYSESMLRLAEHDTETEDIVYSHNPFTQRKTFLPRDVETVLGARQKPSKIPETGISEDRRGTKGTFAPGAIEQSGQEVTPETLGIEKSGMVEAGNINLDNRKKVKTSDGGYQTVFTMTAGIENGKTVLLPRIVEGKVLSEKEAFDHFKQTGEHMGIFNSREAADKYDEKLHKEKGWMGSKNKWNKK